MVSDGNEEHVKEPKIRIIWHLIFASFIIFSIFNFLALPIMRSQFPSNTLVAILFRSYLITTFVYFLCLLFILIFRYYKYLLITSKDLDFKNIVFFYIFGVILFAYLYQSIYLLHPSAFNIPSPVIIPTQFLMDNGLVAYYSLADFIVYSSTIIVSISYPRISSASLIVSIVNVVEVLYGLVVITMLIATFIQKTDKQKDNI